MSDYDTSEFREALEKAFVRDKMDHITLRNSKRESQFLAACASWGVEHGWLVAKAIESFDDQDAGDVRLTLTDEGRLALGLTT
jgi:hypothetical protein